MVLLIRCEAKSRRQRISETSAQLAILVPESAFSSRECIHHALRGLAAARARARRVGHFITKYDFHQKCSVRESHPLAY